MRTVRTIKTITFQWLEKQGACYQAQERFIRLFGQECDASAANARRWLESGGIDRSVPALAGDLVWLARRLMAKLHPTETWRVRSLRIAKEVARHLDLRIPRGEVIVHWVQDALHALPHDRLANAMEQIAARSPNL